MKIGKIIILSTIALFTAISTVDSEAGVIASREKPLFRFKISQDIDYPTWYKIIPHTSHKPLKYFQIEELYDEVDILDLYWPYPDDIPRELFGYFEKVGADAFLESQVERAVLSSTVRMICDGAFRNSMLKEIEFKPGLLYIGNHAFAGCRLADVALPESLTIIRSSAFRDIPTLQRISLPSTLESMGGFTFCGDSSLKRIICRAQTPPKADDTDFGFFAAENTKSTSKTTGPDPDVCVLYVPEESIVLYSQAPGWNRFKNIMAIETSGIERPAADDIAGRCRVEKGAVSISCEAGDEVLIYDLGGILLDSRSFNAPETFRHEGSGLRIIRINDRTTKVILK